MSKCKLTDSEISSLGAEIVEKNCTIRTLAKEKKLSKSSVHNYFRKYLPAIDYSLAVQVEGVLAQNSEEKHIRGGESTKNKYKCK